ncbi:hypothetical protein [Chelativorans salis]|uniref:Uncharacterized protein n=1 Tax=Chelativorans salis TaxID=2978478 RepID=A0ABT2LP03_9HYPH|nr:hypothetical protein [Chelativorans sp. EGI FJ00035]MCT7375567.1 hypothetical protein [Chelativorans sp. EGI FJ00035]
MNIELLGFVTMVLGVAVLFAPIHRAFSIMVLSTLFGAAAAFSLSGLGGASVLVPSLFLVFYGLRLFMAFGEGPVLAAVAAPRAGFWLLLLTVYALATAVFFPRLLEGMAETMTVQRIAAGRSSISMVPLAPSTNNITQAVYALGGLICFAFTFAYLRRVGSLARLASLILVLGAANLAFALLDVVTYYSGAAYLFDYIRTANYALLTGAEKAGFKRISGTFPEASAFAGYTAVLFAFIASLWLDRVRSWTSGVLAGLLLVVLLLATSTTGLLALVAVILFLGLRSAHGSVGRKPVGRPVFLAGAVLGLPLLILLTIILMPEMVERIMEFLDEILFSKLDSQSGRERFMWNAVAYQAFLDTWGLGAGLGSARASSYLLVLLSNVGLLGTIIFFIFFGSILFSKAGPGGAGQDIDDKIARAAKAGLVAGLAEALVSGTVYDLGLMFYLLAGAVAAMHMPVSGVARALAPEASRTRDAAAMPSERASH